MALRRADHSGLFAPNEDRRALDQRVGELLRAYSARAHAYCWMGTHVHLAVEIAPKWAASFQRDLAADLAIFDRQRDPLPIDPHVHLLRLVRYIHLNPVTAGLVREPGGWPYSGHRVYLGERGVPWLAVDLALRLLGGDLLTATAAYRDYVRVGWTPGT